MSLRDQLLKAGVVNKKQVRKANRKLKKNRKLGQSKRQSKKVIRAEDSARVQQSKAAALARRRAEKEARDAREVEQERTRLVANLLRSYAREILPGPQPFFHLKPDRLHIQRLYLRESVAFDLRRGALAIAWRGESAEQPDLILLPSDAALRIRKHAPERILFLNESAPARDDPAEQLYPFEPEKKHRR